MDLRFSTQRVIDRCHELAKISEQPEYILRRYLTEAHKNANALVAKWMQESGMTVWQDQVGNQWGRYDGTDSKLPALVIGSHLDTVPDAGQYDGIIGVILGIEIVERLSLKNKRLPFPIEIVGFGDEEGVRFGTAFLGSHGVTGSWCEEWLQIKDKKGKSLYQSMLDFGLDPQDKHLSIRSPSSILGYWEIHIEQGPKLESLGLPLGVVTGIAGARRATLMIKGKAGHAGTTPMNLRKDALCAASEIILAVEELAKNCTYEAVATSGQVFVNPGATNVISGSAALSLDVRAVKDEFRDDLILRISNEVDLIASRRNVQIQWQWDHEAKSVMCDDTYQQLFSKAMENSGLETESLFSGAGHDAMAMATICPVGMIFIRSPDGLSHHPDESIIFSDVTKAIQVTESALTSYSEIFGESQ